MDEQEYEGWSLVEVMGHRVYWGYLSGVKLAGAGFLRVMIPAAETGFVGEVLLAPSAIFCITPVPEEKARRGANPVVREASYLPLPREGFCDDDCGGDEDEPDDDEPESFSVAGSEQVTLHVDQVVEPLHGGTPTANYLIEESHVEQHEGHDVLVVDKARLESVSWRPGEEP